MKRRSLALSLVHGDRLAQRDPHPSQIMRSLCIGALLLLGSPFSESQTPSPPPAGGTSPGIPPDGPDDRFFLYEGPFIHGVSAVSSFVHDVAHTGACHDVEDEARSMGPDKNSAFCF